MLQFQKDRAWHDIVALDESWFCFMTDHGWIWLSEGTEAPGREWTTVQSRKIMGTMVWNPTRLYRSVTLLKGMKFKMEYYISPELDALAEW
jgi:hypothetical protein